LEDKPANGIYSSGLNIILLDFDRQINNPGLQKHVFHHEIFHWLEFKYLKREAMGWKKHNEDGFKYEEKKVVPRQANPYNYTAPVIPGFITDYSYTSQYDDKSEIFAALMIENENKLISEWAAKDERLAAKIVQMKEVMFSIDQQFDDDFWKTRQGKDRND
jgi:hypothetical protein